jgi:hypothetical protein
MTCDTAMGENCTNCVLDCGSCASCGDGVCQPAMGEDCTSCAMDCNMCMSCGNGTCDMGMGETCISCSMDCGACVAQCADQIDNDNDGKIDWRPANQGDPQCTSPADNSEAN